MPTTADPRREDSSPTGAPPPGRGLEAVFRIAMVVAMVGVLPAIAWLYSTLPPSPDQWQLDYTGWLLTRGEAPYVDIRDGNWPAAHWLHSLSVAVSGPGFGGWRRFDLFLLTLGVIAGASLCSRIWGRSAALWFGLLYPWLYVTAGYWFAGQRDIVATHFSLVALAGHWAIVQGGHRGLASLAGASLTTATLVKPTFAILAGVIALHATLLAMLRRISWTASLQSVALIAIWSIAALFAAVGVLLFQGATLESFWEHAVESMLIRIPGDSLPPGKALRSALDVTLGSWHWIAVGGIAATVLALRGRSPRELSGVLLCWLFVLAGLASSVAQGHGWSYYLAPVFTGLVLLLCGALGQATRLAAQPGISRVFAVIGIAIALGGAVKKTWTAYGPLLPVLTSGAPWQEWEDRFPAGDDLTASDARALAEELRPWLPDGASMLVWGRVNLLNLLVERPQPTGFYHKPHVQRDYLPDRFRLPWTREIIEDLTERPPTVVVIDTQTRFKDTAIRKFIEEMLAARYRKLRTAGATTVYLALDAEAGGNNP